MEVSSKTFRAPRGFSGGHAASVTEWFGDSRGGGDQTGKKGEKSNAKKKSCEKRDMNENVQENKRGVNVGR